MKKRIKHDTIVFCVIALFAIAYYIIIKVTGFSIPCMVKLITGLECPTCGTTRMMLSLTQLHIKEAYSYNPVMLFAIPIALIDVIIEELFYIKSGVRKFHLVSYIILGLIIVTLIIFCFIRNFS